MREGAVTLEHAEALGLLAEPTRRALYELVATCGRPVTRREVAEASGVDRALVAYHLDKLVEHGLLDTERAGRQGDGHGTGRPPKLYRRASRELAAQAPARDYLLLAEVLLAAASRGDAKARTAADQAARETGGELGAAARRSRETLDEALRHRGYEPVQVEGGMLRLRNCPFDRVAGRDPELVCGLNLALLQGMLDAMGGTQRATLDPQPGHCCVAIRSR